MEGVTEAAEGAAQTVLDNAAAWPWVEMVICIVVAAVVAWAAVEMLKVTGLSGLKRKPPKNAGETTVVGALAKQWRGWPALLWSVSMVLGAGVGLFVGSLGDLGMGYGAAFGTASGLANSLAMKLLRKLGDKASDLLLGWAKRRLGNGNGEG
jgi:hypothetical protein